MKIRAILLAASAVIIGSATFAAAQEVPEEIAVPYSQAEVDAFLDTKADKAVTYTKDEVDGKLTSKADIASVYTRQQVDVKITSINTQLGDLTRLRTKADDSKSVFTKNARRSVVNALNALDKRTSHQGRRLDNISDSVRDNKRDIKTNRDNISSNLSSIKENRDNIAANSERIQYNKQQIFENAARITNNSGRISVLEEEVADLKGGVAMAIAIANAPVVKTDKFSLSGGVGFYSGRSASALKFGYLPRENVAITASVATDFQANFSAGGGIGIGF